MTKSNGQKGKQPQTGLALETDIIKKIAHQLERLPKSDPTAADMVVQFVTSALRGGNIMRVATIEKNGQVQAFGE